MEGLTCSILVDKEIGNCSNGGLSERCDSVVILVSDEENKHLLLPFKPSKERPAVKIVKRFIGGREYVHAEPIDPPQNGMIGWMAGGTFIYTSDSRYKQITGVDYPIALHDRCDTQRDYEALSR